MTVVSAPSETAADWFIVLNQEYSPSKKRRSRGQGNGTIYWRTITKNGKDYPQAYYHWKENGKKHTKYIPKKLLGVIQEAEAAKRPVVEILELLGDTEISPSKYEVLGDIEINPSNKADISPSNEISPSKMRRQKGEGSGSIHWRINTKNGRDYPQPWYHYEFWENGDRLVKSTKYISKRLLPQVQQLEQQKAPVQQILKLLGVGDL